MDTSTASATHISFLGTGWSFPPEFVLETGEVLMTSDEDDIEASLKILLGTAFGERFLNPQYGLDMHQILFEPMSTTLTTFLKDKARITILIYEPRINLLYLELDTSAQMEGRVSIIVDYEIKATNSRFNLVYPFYMAEGSEVRASVGVT
ncbi:MAG: GPW/gp25 family protein [Chthoniobacterales bacterium]|nr:GPW/gp25 family protein [Chthoniobacterales bacterium]